MNIQEMIDFLVLCRDKVDLEIPKISINQPLVEISAMLTSKIQELEAVGAGPSC